MMTEATAAPSIANQTSELVVAASSPQMASTTANDAPAFTPRSPGSASGLRVTACITAPLTPSATPTSNATTVRGRRSSRTTR